MHASAILVYPIYTTAIAHNTHTPDEFRQKTSMAIALYLLKEHAVFIYNAVSVNT